MSSDTKIAFLLIHGFTGTHYEMEPLAKHLRKSGYFVDNIVLPGHETSLEDLANKKWQELAEYAQKRLDILKQDFETVYVCGLSMGGSITLYLGEKNPDIAGIIPLAAPAFSPDWRMAIVAFVPFIEFFYPYHKNEEVGWEDLEELQTHKSYGGYPLKFIKQLRKMFNVTKKNLREITIPTLIVYSKNDPSISIKHAQSIYDSIISQKKKIVCIEKGGHVIPKDAGRKQLFQEIDLWLKEEK